MNRILSAICVAALFAGCATTEKTAEKDQYDIRPDATAASAPSAVDWQNANDAKLAALTKKEVLAAFVETPAAADALLAKIGPAYKGDAFVLTQIGCVTQLVMCPKCRKSPARRMLWIAALARAKAAAKDDYVKTFCEQQLRLCRW